ncbi:MAG TPA: formylglycine-generating enzyme family protein, partial [Chthoniobacteraceae bacterium]
PSPSSFDAADSSAPEVSVGGTIAGSMQMDSGDSEPLAAFARLVYRVLAGTEIPSLVQFAPDAYAPTVNLSSSSNRLIREVICRQRQWPTATEFLREMCAAETAPFRGPSHAAIARVIAPGRVKSPYAQGSPPQNLPENQWLPGHEFICSASRRRVALPGELPPWEEPAAPLEFHATPPPEESPAEESSESIQQTVISLPGQRSSSSRQSSQVAEKTPAPPAVPLKRSSKRGMIAALAALAVLASAAVAYWKMFAPATKPGSPSPRDLAFEGKTPGEARTIAGIAFHWCPPTSAAGFMMGSPDSEEGRSADETRHSVVLTHGFWMAETNVTQVQWQTLTGATLRQQAQKAFADDARYGLPGKKQTIRERFAAQNVDQLIGIENPQIPIYWVNWDEAAGCCERATQSEQAAGRVPAGWVITLPTEAQWEYACRAGSSTATYAGDLNPVRRIVGSAPLIAHVLDPIAWYGANSGEGYQGNGFETAKWVERDLRVKIAGPHPAGTKNANAWGLKDMLGNISEWCEDWYAGYSGDPETDPLGPGYGYLRVHRGGSWSATAAYCRAAVRFRVGPRIRMRNVGFRLAVMPARSQPQTNSKGPPPQDSSALEGDGSN